LTAPPADAKSLSKARRRAMDAFVTGLIAALVGGVSGYVSAFLTNVIERRKVIDESVRGVRTGRYAELWRATALLPKWPRNDQATYEDVRKLSEGFRAWYFGTSSQPSTPTPAGQPQDHPAAAPSPSPEGPGGMYLSSQARKAYGTLQELIAGVVARERVAGGLDRPLSPEDYGAIQDRASRLRTEMTTDLLSRRRTFMVR
jgi:hypothetical protein